MWPTGPAVRGQDGVEEILTTIETSSRQAADDLRQLLGTLREPDPVPEPPAAATTRWPVDVAVAVAVTVFTVGGVLVPDPSSEAAHAEASPAALLTLSALPGAALLLRRRFPVAVLAVVLAVVVTVYALRWPEGTVPAALVVAGYSVGAWAPWRRGLAALAAVCSGLALAMWVAPTPVVTEPGLVAVVAVPWAVGAAVRLRRVRDQAELDALAEAEREGAVRLRRAVLDERLAVARDLHDVVGHNLSGIVIQAAAARRRADGGADAEVLRTVERAARAALRDLQRMEQSLTSPTTRQPVPGSDDLALLVARYRQHHADVSLDVGEGVAAEPGSTQLTVYRVVQEGLTNAAGAAADHVVGAGVGLTGLAERVGLLGGALETGPTDDGGFRLHATLPSRAAVRR